MLLNEVKKTLKNLPPFKKVVVGVSGGVDSIVLAHILHTLGYEIIVAHLNHGLRGKESDDDAKFVRELAQKMDVPFLTCKVDIPKKGNTENNGRIMRYEFLEKIRESKNAEFIAVAHHADDQVETVLMHMQRGAGLRGIMGMSLGSGYIVRPLLTVNKASILEFAKHRNLEYSTDSSNLDINFRRNYLRHVAIPEFKKNNPDFEKRIIALSGLAQRRVMMLEKEADKWIKQFMKNDKFNKSDFSKLSGDIQSEIIFMITGRQDVYRKNIDSIKSLIANNDTGKQISISGITFRNEYDEVVLYKDCDKKKDLKKVKLPKKEITWGIWRIKYRGGKEVFVRQWKSGDRIKPAGMKGSKKLQDFFTDNKIPKSERHSMPIIVDKNDNVLGISDFRVAKGADYLKECLQITKN